MHRVHAALTIAGAVTLTLLGPGRATAAAPGLTVGSDALTYAFADSMTFALQATSPAPVAHVVLRYQTEAGGPVNRREPSFGPGTHLDVRHVEHLERGEIPPSATIRWWWSITDASGQEVVTPPRSETYLDEHFDWRSDDGRGVRLWTYGGSEGDDQAIVGDAERTLDELAAVIGSRPDRQIHIVAYRSPQDMLRALVPHGEVYESQLTTLGARVAPDIILLLVAGPAAQRRDVMAHELSHAVLDLHFAEPYVDAPLWLDEGLAMYNEGTPDRSEQTTLDDAVRSDALMSVQSLTSFPGQADLVPLAYAESRDIVDYLIATYGGQPFRLLLDTLGEGETDADGALEQVYGYDQLGLYQAYRAFKGLAPAATPAPGQLRPSRPRRASSGGGVCGSVVLVIPAAVVFRRRSRRTGGRQRP